MKYKVLTKKEILKTSKEFLHQQELDHCVHKINIARYEKILEHPDGLSPKFLQQIQMLRNQAKQRITEVESIIQGSAYPKESFFKRTLRRIPWISP